ncbi:SAM-dependent methyltransferase [Peterkaempfera bronchialis]|uniref:SAM-dependent methyltransferase n=1 Tax=Peterkaempfera bronchialis TaxID=2126346 RepID=UPI003C2E215A
MNSNDALVIPARVDPVGLRTDVPHPARMYDYYLGGKTHFAADRLAAQQVLEAFPYARVTATENRGFLLRAVMRLAQSGVHQFLDIGTGIPTEPNVHQVVQAVEPSTRVVYVDNDPIVLAHARALMMSTASGRTAYVEADLREGERILEAGSLTAVLDLGRPVALVLGAILHFLPDVADPYGIVRRLIGRLATGSYLVVSHVTGDWAPELWARITETYHLGGIPLQVRSRSEVARFFHGLDLIEPGLKPVHWWHPSDEAGADPGLAAVSCYGGVARVP